MSDAPSRNDDTLLALGILGAVGIAAYQFWWLPNEAKRLLDADIARRRAVQPGLTKGDALAQIAGIGCTVYGASNGLPPQVTGEICMLLGQSAAGVVRALPGVAKDVGKAGLMVLKTPVNIVGGVANEVAKPVKAVVRDVGKGAKAVGNFFSHLF